MIHTCHKNSGKNSGILHIATPFPMGISRYEKVNKFSKSTNRK